MPSPVPTGPSVYVKKIVFWITIIPFAQSALLNTDFLISLENIPLSSDLVGQATHNSGGSEEENKEGSLRS